MTQLVTTTELLKVLDISRSTFDNYRKAGLTPEPEKIGKSFAWDPVKVREWMRDNGKTGKRGEPPAWAKAKTKTVSTMSLDMGKIMEAFMGGGGGGMGGGMEMPKSELKITNTQKLGLKLLKVTPADGGEGF